MSIFAVLQYRERERKRKRETHTHIKNNSTLKARYLRFGHTGIYTIDKRKTHISSMAFASWIVQGLSLIHDRSEGIYYSAKH